MTTFDEWFRGTFPNADKQQREIARRVWNAAIDSAILAVEPHATIERIPEPPKIATPTPPPKPKPAPPKYTRTQLEGMLKTDLLKLAKTLGCETYPGDLKIDLVDMLEAHCRKAR